MSAEKMVSGFRIYSYGSVPSVLIPFNNPWLWTLVQFGRSYRNYSYFSRLLSTYGSAVCESVF